MIQKMAIVGFGGQGKLFSNAASKLLADRLEVVAICDINPDAFNNKPGNESWQTVYRNLARVKPPQGGIYQDFRKMLDEVKPDIVTVATWTKDHALVIEEAVKAGVKKILCEIPMAPSLKGARRIINICKDNDVLLVVNHSRRWWSDHQEIRRLIHEEKVIGDLRHIWISCGGARLSDLGIHWIDWALWVAGEKVDKVFGKLDEIAGENPRGDHFFDYPGEILIFFKGGATAYIHQGRDVALPPRYEVVGTKGRIFGEQLPVKWQIDVRSEENSDPVRDYYGKMEKIPFQYNPEIDIEATTAASLKELLEGKTSCGGKEGYATLEVLVAAHFESKSFVQFPLFLSDERGHLKGA